jgi:TonB family protein
MSTAQIWDNVVAYTLQIGLLLCLGALVPAVLRLRMPRARLLFWQLLLVACLALPWVRPWRQEVANGSIQMSTAITAVASTAQLPSALVRRDAIPFREIALWLLVAGVIIRLALFGLGLVRLAAYRRRGREMPPDTAGSHAALLLSDDVSGPVTFGWLKPVVLLPSRFPSLTSEMREAILRHELMHVKRRDWLFTIAEELVRAVLWFHPAIWWVIGEIQLAREQTVDQAVIEATQAREPYVDALLLMAGVPISVAPAPMFLRRRHLKRRLTEAMREVRMATISKTRLVCMLSAAVAMVAAACWVATGAFPLAAAPQVVADSPGVSVNMNGAQLMHRSPVPYPAEVLAKGVEGTVVVQVKLDSKGEVADAAVLSGPDELRRAVQQSVLTWHFDKSVAMTTQVVDIDFSKAAAASGNAQPADKVLYDQAINRIEHRDYEGARLALNTLINSYATSEYVPKAKLAIADSRFREGGAHGVALAEAEYRDFILFYPNLRDAAESRLRQIQQQIAGTATTAITFAPPPPPPPPTSAKLTRITVTGLSDSARAELLSRLPVREGSEWSAQMSDAVAAAAKEFDSHLRIVLTPTGAGELGLTIGPGTDAIPVFSTGVGGGMGAGVGGGRAAAVPVTPPSGVYKVGNGVTQPKVLFKADPVLPDEAGANNLLGTVILSCVIGTSGQAEEIRVVKSIDQAFDSNAVEAVSKWVFQPGMSDGVPVKVRATIEVNFQKK